MDGDELINDGATPLTLEFDYEIHTSLDLNDISIAIAEFQNDLAAGVAETYDFKECRRKRELRVSSSGRKLGKYATVVEESTGMETSAPIVGCASVPSDEPDNNISECGIGDSFSSVIVLLVVIEIWSLISFHQPSFFLISILRPVRQRRRSQPTVHLHPHERLSHHLR